MVCGGYYELFHDTIDSCLGVKVHGTVFTASLCSGTGILGVSGYFLFDNSLVQFGGMVAAWKKETEKKKSAFGITGIGRKNIYPE